MGYTAQIAHELNQDGIKTVLGKQWDTQHIYRILNNYTYAGMVFYEGECWPGEHNAIIDRKTWDLAQSFLRANAPIKKLVRTRSSEAALNGIIRCGHCNS